MQKACEVIYNIMALPALALTLLAGIYLVILCAVCPLFWGKLRHEWINARNNRRNAEREEAEIKDMEAKIKELKEE